jgi:AraC-like DNA-binding protein
MPTSGSVIFSDADDYQAKLGEAFDFLVVPRRGFYARLTQVELPHLHLLRAQEALPHVAYVSLPPEYAFVTFLTRRGAPLVCDGVDLAFGQMMFHSHGEHFHQRTTEASQWGFVSLTPASLMSFGRALAGRDLDAPSVGRILQPVSADWTRLLRLHAEAGRIAETKLNHIRHPEVARALEQELIWALVTCLTSDGRRVAPAVKRADSETLARLEEVRAAHPAIPLPTKDVCSAVCVSQDTLRASCLRVLGMDAGRYLHLRRLELVRMALLRADPATASITEITQRYGFASPLHFAEDYVDAYGEAPTMPARQHPN